MSSISSVRPRSGLTAVDRLRPLTCGIPVDVLYPESAAATALDANATFDRVWSLACQVGRHLRSGAPTSLELRSDDQKVRVTLEAGRVVWRS